MRFGVILAGGGGTRLWPASRRAKPKQLLDVTGRGGGSLLSATVDRLERARIDELCVVTAAEQQDATIAAVPSLEGRLLVEPCGRNTAAALGLAAVQLSARDPDAVIGAVPADHHVADVDAFASAFDQALDIAAASDVICTLGIVPTHPETGFGYLELGDERDGGGRTVARFVEKPDRETAERYVASGNYLWNAGMFFFRASRLLADIERLMPDTFAVLSAIRDAYDRGGDEAGEALANERYRDMPKVSIDYGVMEKATDVVTVPGDFGWNDIGSWTALADVTDADEHANHAVGAAIAIDAHGNVTSTDDGVVALIGVDNLVVVRAGNAVLVAPRERAQQVRDVVAALQDRGDHGDYL